MAGGKRRVQKLCGQVGGDFGRPFKTQSPNQKIVRSEGQVILTMPDGSEQSFDEVILACHADQSLQLLSSPTDEETNLLSSFPYQKNKVTLHSDDSVIPKRKSARASWNAFLPKEKSKEALVTYDMNILQSLPTTEPFCVSLNQQNILSEEKIHGNYNFSHPTYHSGRKQNQARHSNFIRNKGVSLCGAYWGYGFHEDGLKSGLRVCEALENFFNEKLPLFWRSSSPQKNSKKTRFLLQSLYGSSFYG